MKYIVNCVNVPSVLRINILIFFLIGIIFGIVYLYVFGGEPFDLHIVLSDAVRSGLTPLQSVLWIFLFAVEIAMIMSITVGFGALIYNFASDTVGGFEFTLRKESMLETTQVPHVRNAPRESSKAAEAAKKEN